MEKAYKLYFMNFKVEKFVEKVKKIIKYGEK